MKKALGIGLGVLVLFASGAAATLLLVKLQPEVVLSWVGVEQAARTSTSQAASVAPSAPETALDMAYATLTDTLRSEQGFALDHYSLSYLIISNQQMTGLLKTIEETEANATIRSLASSKRIQSEESVTQLLLLQKQLGHVHH